MPSRSPKDSRDSQPAGLSPEQCLPQPPEKLFVDDLNRRVNHLVNRGAELLTNHLNSPELSLTIGGKLVETNGSAARGFANVVGFTQPSLIPAERELRVRALIQEKTRQLLSARPSLVDDYAAHMIAFGVPVAVKPGDGGLSPVQMKEESERTFVARLENEVETIIRNKISYLENSSREAHERESNDRIEFLKQLGITPNHQVSDADLDKWIKCSGVYDVDVDGRPRYQAEIAKLEESGMLSGPTGSLSPNYFRNIRAAMMGCWGASALAFAGCAAVGAVSPFAVAAILGGNFGVQRFVLSHLFGSKFEAMMRQMRTQVVFAGPMQAAVAWSGLMFKFIRDYSPVWLAPGRTQLFNDHPATSTDAMLNRIKDVALHAARIIKDPPANLVEQQLYDQKYKDKCEGFKDGLDNLAARWKYGQDKQVDVAFWAFGAAATYWGALLLASL